MSFHKLAYLGLITTCLTGCGHQVPKQSSEIEALQQRLLELDRRIREKTAESNRIVFNNGFFDSATRTSSPPKTAFDVPFPHLLPTRIPESSGGRAIEVQAGQLDSLHQEINELRKEYRRVAAKLQDLGGCVPEHESCKRCKGKGIALGYHYEQRGFNKRTGFTDYEFKSGIHVCTPCRGTGVAIASEKDDDAPSVEGPALEISSINQIILQWEENGVAAKQKYVGKRIRYSGRVKSIGEATVAVEDHEEHDIFADNFYEKVSPGVRWASCLFTDDQHDFVSRLKRGKRVTVTGVLAEINAVYCVVEQARFESNVGTTPGDRTNHQSGQSASMIQGRVSLDGSPVQGLIVRIRSASDPTRAVSATTGLDGRFTEELPPGQYVVTFNAKNDFGPESPEGLPSVGADVMPLELSDGGIRIKLLPEQGSAFEFNLNSLDVSRCE